MGRLAHLTNLLFMRVWISSIFFKYMYVHITFKKAHDTLHKCIFFFTRVKLTSFSPFMSLRSAFHLYIWCSTLTLCIICREGEGLKRSTCREHCLFSCHKHMQWSTEINQLMEHFFFNAILNRSSYDTHSH